MATDASVDPNFTIVMRGYERDEVDAYLRDLVAETARLGDRVAQLEQELADARTRADSGGSPEEGFRALGEETTRILVAAETAAREMREKAERQADAELAAAEKAARERVETATAHADRIVAEAEGRQRDVEAEIQRLENVRATMVDSLRGAIATTQRAIAEAPSPDAGAATATRSASAAPVEQAAPAAVGDELELEPAPGVEDRPPQDTTATTATADTTDTTATADAAVADDERADTAVEEAAAAPDATVEPDAVEAEEADVTAAAAPTAATATAPTTRVEEAPATEPEELHGGADRGALEAALAEADAAAGRAPTPTLEPGETDAGMLRERSLAGIRPGMLRRLRRSLQELQNGVLESVRTRDDDTVVEDLLPTDAEAGGLAEVARVFLDAGYRAGRADAPVLTGEEALQDPPTDTHAVAGSADALAEELLVELRTTLAPSLRAGADADEPDASLSERVGEVFRDLKGPIIETVVDRYLTEMYGEATLDGLEDQGVAEVRWVLGEESRCPEGMCRANAAEGAIERGSNFPSGHAVPLAHEGCTCALEPA